MGLTSRLLGRAARAAIDRAKDTVDADRVLQLAMAGLIETARTRHESEPAPAWRSGEPLKLLLAGYVGTRNTGADVRTEEMVRQFRHLFGDEHADLSILTIDPALTRGYFRTVKQRTLPQIFPKYLYDTVRTQHGVVACEGSMFKSKFASALSTMMVGALGLALAEDKLAVGYGGEAGAMDPGLEDMVRRYCGASADRRGALVITRNPESSAVLAKVGVGSRPGTDTAWTFDAAPSSVAEKHLRRAGWDGEQPILVVCPINPFWWPVRPDPWKAAVHGLTGAHDRAHYRSIYFHAESEDIDRRLSRYLTELAGAVKDYRKKRPCFVAVVGMEALDREACERFAERLGPGTATFVSDEHDMWTMVAILRRASLIVSSRYHAIVCSMPAGVPSVGVTMDERIRNLMSDRGQPELCLECDATDLDEKLLAAMERATDEADRVRDGIERCVAVNLRRMGEMGMSLVDHVRELHPRFPFASGLGSGGDPLAHLPPLAEPQARILSRWSDA